MAKRGRRLNRLSASFTPPAPRRHRQRYGGKALRLNPLPAPCLTRLFVSFPPPAPPGRGKPSGLGVAVSIAFRLRSLLRPPSQYTPVVTAPRGLNRLSASFTPPAWNRSRVVPGSRPVSI